MEQKEKIDRRSMLRTAGLGLALAGATISESLANCGGCGPKEGDKDKEAKKCPHSHPHSHAAKGTKCGSDRAFKRKQFHHIGIPTQTRHENERYLAGGLVYITDPEQHPYHIEWCRWLPESKDPELLRTTPHIAFEVGCVDSEIAKYDEKEIYLKPFVPFQGVKVAFVNHEGTLIEFLQKT